MRINETFYKPYICPPLSLTNNGRSNDGSKALEEHEQAERIGELVETDEVDEDDGGQADVSAARGPKQRAVNNLTGIVITEVAQTER